jgi:transposase
MKTPIGIDVSKNTLDVCVLQGEDRQRHHKFSNSEFGFKALVAWVMRQSPEGSHHFCMESTGGYSFGLAAHLADNGHTVSVENARRVKHFAIAANLKVKTDKADAHCIARYVQAMNPRQWVLKNLEERELCGLRTRLRQIEKVRLAERSRLENPHLDECVGRQILEHLTFLGWQTKEAQGRVRELLSKSEKSRTIYRAVTGINGVGAETGLLLATLDIESFDDAQAVAVFFGLNPRLHQSGKFCGKTRISKQGDSPGRATLICAAGNAYRYNPFFKTFYDRLIARGLRHKQALAAVARKLVMIAWAVARNALRGLPVNYPGGELRGPNLRVYCANP